ncbi:MAG: hypothetical protein Q7J68_07980 [Thermoplasmata archaeon]|nr:hypothetical protein [Thermoplasmata archaeon]
MLEALQLTGYDPLFGGACCLIYIVIFIVYIYLCVWVYRDAEKRGSSGALWAVLVFFFGWIALIIWLLVRPPIRQYGYQGYGYMAPPPTPVFQYCPGCGQPMTFVPQYNRWYCNYCRKYQ